MAVNWIREIQGQLRNLYAEGAEVRGIRISPSVFESIRNSEFVFRPFDGSGDIKLLGLSLVVDSDVDGFTFEIENRSLLADIRQAVAQAQPAILTLVMSYGAYNKVRDHLHVCLDSDKRNTMVRVVLSHKLVVPFLVCENTTTVLLL